MKILKFQLFILLVTISVYSWAQSNSELHLTPEQRAAAKKDVTLVPPEIDKNASVADGEHKHADAIAKHKLDTLQMPNHSLNYAPTEKFVRVDNRPMNIRLQEKIIALKHKIKDYEARLTTDPSLQSNLDEMYTLLKELEIQIQTLNH